MELSTVLVAAFVFGARLCDVALATLRHVLVVRGYRAVAAGVALLESSLWVFAMSRVLTRLDQPVIALAFALGFTAGTLAGMTLEQRLKLGEQVVRLFTPIGNAMAYHLRSLGYRVTQFEGMGRDGRIDLLFVQVQRKQVGFILTRARQLDPTCFCVVDDVRTVHQAK
ncbi:MAG: DUF5698 domain-containing protein [Polyangiaceae bacterium]